VRARAVEDQIEGAFPAPVGCHQIRSRCRVQGRHLEIEMNDSRRPRQRAVQDIEQGCAMNSEAECAGIQIAIA